MLLHARDMAPPLPPPPLLLLAAPAPLLLLCRERRRWKQQGLPAAGRLPRQVDIWSRSRACVNCPLLGSRGN
jgi:hypothetical protein